MHLLENIVYCVNGKIFASILNDVFDVDDVNESAARRPHLCDTSYCC